MQMPARLVPLVLTALLALSAASERDAIPVDNFEGAASEDGLPEGWSELTFDSIERHTRYQVAEEAPEGDAATANRYLHATSRDAASALYRRVEIDLKEYPILKWRWRIRRTVPRGDARSKETDDYAARL